LNRSFPLLIPSIPTFQYSIIPRDLPQGPEKTQCLSQIGETEKVKMFVAYRNAPSVCVTYHNPPKFNSLF
jgi:hypothetical protein